jgi:excisionase family DNA binding protein
LPLLDDEPPIIPLQVTVKHAARLLGYSVRTVYRLIEQGELETTGHRHLLRVTYDSILAYQQRTRNRREAC